MGSKEFQLVFEELKTLNARVDELTQRQPQSNVIGFLDFIARLATAPPRVDGHLQFSEVLTGIGLVGGAWVVGAFGTWVTGDPEIVRFCTRLSCYGCLILWGLDIVNPAGIWDETVGRFLDSLAERTAELIYDAPDQPKVRLLPVYSATGKPKQVELEMPPEPEEYELPDGQSISVRDLLGFVTTAARTGDWTRSGWCGGDGKPGRGMSQPMYYAIRDELQRDGIKVWGKGLDSPALRAFLHSFENA